MAADSTPSERREALTASVVRNVTAAVAGLATVATALYLLVGAPANPELRPARLGAIAAIAAVAAIAFALSWTGWRRWSAGLFLAGEIALLVAFPVVFHIGVWSGALPTLTILIMFAGLVLGAGAAAATTAVAVAAVLCILAGQKLGVYTVATDRMPPVELIATVLIVVFLVIGWLTARYAELSGGAIASLERSERDLQALVGQLRESEERLKAAIADVEFANRSKSRFLATMSHEIRTPLNGILGMAQLLLIPGASEDKRIEYARTILASGEILLALLGDILDLAKIEAGRFELVPVAFAPDRIVAETGALFGDSARRKGLRFDAAWLGPADRRYVADPVRLRQMLSNLVDNAIKFTPDGFVRLEGREIDSGGGAPKLEFVVADSGIGIPRELQASLFQPFVQVEGGGGWRQGGTGLGLSIVRNLAELMGGAAGVESEPGKGSRFWFRVPAATSAP